MSLLSFWGDYAFWRKEQIMYEIFRQLLQKHGITPYRLCKDIGLSQNSITNWKTGKSQPKSETMKKIADYFGVSMNYLMTGSEEEAPKYYLNPETAKKAQELFENPEMRILFDAARDASPEDLQIAADILIKLKKRGI